MTQCNLVWISGLTTVWNSGTTRRVHPDTHVTKKTTTWYSKRHQQDAPYRHARKPSTHDTRHTPCFPQNKKLKEVEASRFQLAEGAKRVDAKRRELMRQSEHQRVRLEALEKELDRQLGISDEQRRKVSEPRVAYSCRFETAAIQRHSSAAAKAGRRGSLP